MLAVVVTLTAVVALADSTPAEQCHARARSGVEAFVVMTKPAARDTIVRATVCVVGSAPVRIASYHGELSFDSTLARVVSVEKPNDGMRVDNAKRPGSVRFAGAAPEGFKDPAFVTVGFRVSRPGTSPRVRLRMVELNGTDGVSLLKNLVTSDGRP
jgi:hypothetical protein